MVRGVAVLGGVLLSGLTLAGCNAAFDEARLYHMEQEWRRFWGQNDQREPFQNTWLKQPSPLVQPCQTLPVERRVLTQAGVEDQITYTQCWQADPYTQVGQRMGNRPEPQAPAGHTWHPASRPR